jgi:hypothetical protein
MSRKYLPSTSRDLDPTNYAWDSVVYQAGRPMLDSELNLTQDILNKKDTLPSGIISYQGQDDTIGSFAFQAPSDPTFTANAFVINPFKAMINGMVIDVRNTDATDGTNKITLPPPDTGGGLGVNRGDFVFLEVWRREVTPAMQSKSRVKIIAPLANDTFDFKKGGNTVRLTVNVDFAVGLSLAESARNMAQAINDYDGVNAGLTVDGITTFAETRGTEYLFLSHNGGASGNHSGGLSFTLVSSNNAGIRVLNQPAGGSDGEGKPGANKVYFAGNVLSDPTTHLDDHIQDPNVTVSSTRRIQVQYRIRSVQNTNLSDFIFGFESGVLNAQGSQSLPVGGYNFSRHSTDNGLWYAGTGSEADATNLGTVDGYVYAIPLCYVFRRYANSGGSGFNPLDYFNTGALHDHDGVTLSGNIYVDNVAVGESDRPDGLFADQIAEVDVLDLRRRVYPRGIDFSAELDYQYHSLLDGTNKTWFAKAHNLQITGNGTGGASHSPLVCDVYGRQLFNNQNVGQWRSEFDHVVRRFTNEPTTERIYIVAKPANEVQVSTGIIVNPAGAGNYWFEGDEIIINLGTLMASGHLLWENFGSQSFQLSSVGKLIDIGYCWHNDGHYANAIEQQVRIRNIIGLGTNLVKITLDSSSEIANGGISGGADYDLIGGASNGESTGSNKEIFIEMIFDYASTDRGLSGTVVEAPTPDPSGYPTGSAILIQSPPTNAYDPYTGQGNGNAPPISNVIPNTREVSLEYVYAEQTIQLVSNSPTSSYLPWRLYYNSDPLLGLTPTITDQSGGGAVLTLDESATNYQHAESKIGWTSGGGWATGQRLVEVTAYPLEVYPSDVLTDSTILVYYRRNAPKTVGADFAIASPVNVANGGHVPDELNLQPLAISKEVSVYLKTSNHYPFFNPTEELATHNNAQAGYSEYKVLSAPELILDDLKINTGSVSLPSFVPFVSSVNVCLGDNDVLQPPRKDNEGRVFYPTMEEASYFPSAFAKNMGGYHSNYKTTLPCLMKVVDDSHTLYRKGEVVLVVFVKTNEWGQGVAVDMRETLSDNYVAACVYRTRNQLLLGE